uniref:Uncharacterized protein n=1 Tax=Onchocerca volvulus TaxID=6282 RepID=A0A8R1XWE6_ONCVO
MFGGFRMIRLKRVTCRCKESVKEKEKEEIRNHKTKCKKRTNYMPNKKDELLNLTYQVKMQDLWTTSVQCWFSAKTLMKFLQFNVGLAPRCS